MLKQATLKISLEYVGPEGEKIKVVRVFNQLLSELGLRVLGVFLKNS
jgi:hypothetical protein